MTETQLNLHCLSILTLSPAIIHFRVCGSSNLITYERVCHLGINQAIQGYTVARISIVMHLSILLGVGRLKSISTSEYNHRNIKPCLSALCIFYNVIYSQCHIRSLRLVLIIMLMPVSMQTQL